MQVFFEFQTDILMIFEYFLLCFRNTKNCFYGAFEYKVRTRVSFRPVSDIFLWKLRNGQLLFSKLWHFRPNMKHVFDFVIYKKKVLTSFRTFLTHVVQCFCNFVKIRNTQYFLLKLQISRNRKKKINSFLNRLQLMIKTRNVGDNTLIQLAFSSNPFFKNN